MTREPSTVQRKDHTPRRLKDLLDDLFTNACGDVADRLVLTQDGPRKRDLGGWNRIAVLAVMLKHFPELAQEDKGKMGDWTPGQKLAGALTAAWGFAAAFNDNAADAAFIVVLGVCCLAGAC